MILIYILFALSQVCRAVHDTLWYHFNQSIFSNPYIFLQSWWNPLISDGNKYNGGIPSLGRKKWFWIINEPVQFSDATHTFTLFEIVFHFSAVVVALSVRPEAPNIVIFCVIAFIAYNGAFGAFFDWLLLKDVTFKMFLKKTFNVK